MNQRTGHYAFTTGVFWMRLQLFLLLFRFGMVDADYADVIRHDNLEYHIRHWRSTGKWVANSPDFPLPYPLTSIVYIYNVTNTDPGGQVRLTFDDFSLHPSSVIKIYDGGSISSRESTWRGHNRPFYQSAGNTLMMVFKSGEPIPDDDDSGKQPYYVGFSAVFMFVSESRDEWLKSTAPAAGCCDNYGAVSFLGEESRPLPCDCVWSQSLSEPQYISLVLPSVDWIKDGKLTVLYHGGSSRSMDVWTNGLKTFNKSTDGNHQVLFGPTTAFYIRLQAYLKRGQLVAFANASSKHKAVELAGGVFPRSSPCPYKTCNAVTRFVCVRYWERCYNNVGLTGVVGCANGEQIAANGAFLQAHDTCDGNTRCYQELDMCDGWQDCVNNDDEEGCENFLWDLLGQRRFLGALVGFFFFWVALAFCRRWYQQRGSPRNDRNNTCHQSITCCLSSCPFSWLKTRNNPGQQTGGHSSRDSSPEPVFQPSQQRMNRSLPTSTSSLALIGAHRHGRPEIGPPPAYNEAMLNSDSDISTIATNDGSQMTSHLSVHGDIPSMRNTMPDVGVPATSMPQPPSYEEALTSVDKPNSPPPPYDSIT